MPNEAITVSPDGYEDQETGEFIITDFAIDGSSNREAINREHTQTQEQHFIQDEDGNSHYRNPVNQGDFDTLIDDFGGQDGVERIKAYAANNLDEEMIQRFNYAVEQGDISDLYHNFSAIQQMIEADPYSQVDVDDYDSDADYIFENLIPESDYYEMVEQARETLPERTILAFNRVMADGSLEQKIDTISMIQRHIRGN